MFTICVAALLTAWRSALIVELPNSGIHWADGDTRNGIGCGAAGGASPGNNGTFGIYCWDRAGTLQWSNTFNGYEGVYWATLSGDGGWAALDRGITKELHAHGVSVVGLNSRAYLSNRRTADDVTRAAISA